MRSEISGRWPSLGIVHPGLSLIMTTPNNRISYGSCEKLSDSHCLRTVFLCGLLSLRGLFRRDRNQPGRNSGPCDIAVQDCFGIEPSAIRFAVIVHILPQSRTGKRDTNKYLSRTR